MKHVFDGNYKNSFTLISKVMLSYSNVVAGEIINNLKLVILKL